MPIPCSHALKKMLKLRNVGVFFDSNQCGGCSTLSFGRTVGEATAPLDSQFSSKFGISPNATVAEVVAVVQSWPRSL